MDDEQSFQADAASGAGGWSARNVRLLKGAVYIMGGLIVLGTVALVGAIVMKVGDSGEKRAQGFGDLEVAVPAGAAITASRLDGDRLAIDIASPAGAEVVIVDVKKGIVIGRVKLRPAGQ
jgi:hypothetical protein